MKKFTQYLACSLSLGLVFSICKIIYMGMIDASYADWIGLVPNIGLDVIAGFIVCLIVVINRPIGILFVYLGIIFYCISWFYAILFDGFLHAEALVFGENAFQLND